MFYGWNEDWTDTFYLFCLPAGQFYNLSWRSHQVFHPSGYLLPGEVDGWWLAVWGENCPSLRMKIIIVLVRGGEVRGTFYKAGAMKEMKRRVLSGWAWNINAVFLKLLWADFLSRFHLTSDHWNSVQRNVKRKLWLTVHVWSSCCWCRGQSASL